MRLWTLHPTYLDRAGLVALWREALLARGVLRGDTKGYRHHPQLERFRDHSAPRSAINAYLRVVLDEADRRGYRFDRSKVGPVRDRAPIAVPLGQIAFERRHLASKLERRAPDRVALLPAADSVRVHPLFVTGPGPVAPWERGA